MSLFSGLGGAQPAASGTSTSTPGTSSLFGGAQNTASGTTSSLFGASTAASGSAPPASSGGGLGLGGSLFGGALGGAPKPAATSTPSLFGAASTSAATAQPQTQTSGFSLFSQPPAAQPPQTGGLGQPSLFGGASTQQQQPPQQQQQQQQQDASLSQSAAGTGRSAHFDHLLERGRKRNAGENGFGSFDELPSLQLGLGDIARKVRNLGVGGPSADQAQDRAAHYLLSASGVKMGSTLRDLNQFSTQAGLSAAGPSQSFLDTDVDGYVSNLHSQSTLALIQEGLEQSKRDFDTFLEDNVQIEWDKQRQKIYEHFGLGRQSEELAALQTAFGSTARGAFGRSTRKGRSMGPKGASVNGASTFGASAGGPPVIGLSQSVLGGRDALEKSVLGGQAGPQDRYVRDKQEKFMEEVKRLNDARQRDDTSSVLHAFASVEKAANGEYSDHFISAYGALISITGEATELDASTPGSKTPKARSFAKDYLDDQPNSASSVRMRKRILDGSRKYLESKFLDHVEEVLKKNPTEALVGGIPSLLNKMRGFVRAKVAFKELGADTELFQRIGDTGEEYPWVIVFYLLRAGLLTEAAEYVREKRNFFQNNDRNFQAAITHYATDPERRLTPELHQKISHVHAQRSRIATANDPYRTACYKIVGRCEMSRRNLEPIRETMDDWVWLQFNLAREGNRAEENAGEIFGLEELRTTIKEIGQRHFMNDETEAAGGYGVYFYLATLAGMFEPAINYLYQHNYVSAVHFAIALDYYGLLRVSEWTTAGSEILTYTTRQQPQLNFGRVIGYYTSDFRSARADAAADYLVLICLNADLPGEAGKQQAELCHEALRELVLETREFSTLLGDVRSNGQTTLGLIQERVPLLKLQGENGLLNTITREAAKMADDNGRTNDAVLLCHLAGEYDSVVAILNRALAEALSVELGQEPLRLEPLKPRLTPADIQQQQQQQASSLNSSSLSMLGTDDPVELAQQVIALYNANGLWWKKVSQINRDTLGVLFQLNNAKKTIESRSYIEALDRIESLRVLPLSAHGNLSEIRASANNFSSYPPEIARNIGNVLLWCIGCCSRHREHLLSGQFDDPVRRELAEQLLQKAKDLMVFAGLIRYKLPPRVFETLAREGQDVGAY
ncbi:nuclear pore protein-like protein [Dothidotthia symphoricarpi CBS 119687]|uniref:Nuclear pore protein-like protein n=1 Tax=Dothidotthia symphoricarpi CBS 119687 TaxID=1392245 RepID=A0A6A6AQI2_9PLEO|nr:nuclear pore protein-like protein [Dothidotthia symphoricarpi CBS 119687]KAF2133275.1 nuclear pore protein-like protein [Dothidotthia symphoricarpi CBS 119687]